MLNKTNKGNRYELLARKELEGWGYLTEKKNASRWQSNDFWGLFDILAIHPSGDVRLIQVKTNKSDFYKARKEIKKFVKEKKIDGVSCEVWIKEPRKEWCIEFITDKLLKEIYETL